MSETRDLRGDFVRSLSIFVFILVLAFVSGFLLTSLGAYQDADYVKHFTLYTIFGSVGLAYILVVTLSNYLLGFRFLKVILHEPEESVVGGFKWEGNPWLLSLLSVIVFLLPMFYLVTKQQSFFGGVYLPAQSVLGAGVAGVWGSSVFPAVAENLFFFLPLCLWYSVLYKKFYERRRTGAFFFSWWFLTTLVFGGLWVLFHLSVYGSSEASLFFTAGFGIMMIAITVFTMSFFPWLIAHFLLNFFSALKEYGLASSDLVTVLVWAVWVLCVVLFFLGLGWTKKTYHGIRV